MLLLQEVDSPLEGVLGGGQLLPQVDGAVYLHNAQGEETTDAHLLLLLSDLPSGFEESDKERVKVSPREPGQLPLDHRLAISMESIDEIPEVEEDLQ